MRVMPLRQEIAGNLINMLDSMSMVVLATEYAQEQLRTGKWVQANVDTYWENAKKKILQREQTMLQHATTGEEVEAAYTWTDTCSQSLFIASTFKMAEDIIAARLTGAKAAEIQQLIMALDRQITEAQTLRDAGNLRPQTFIAFNAAKIIATTDKNITMQEANQMAISALGK